MPSVGNGYLGTVVFSDTVHASGLFSGRAYSKKNSIYPVYLYQHTHRARIPSTVALEFRPDVQGNVSYALDVADGVFYMGFESAQLFVKERIYAHRSRKNLIVVEITANNTDTTEHELFMKLGSGNYSKDIAFWEYSMEGMTQAQYAVGEVHV